MDQDGSRWHKRTAVELYNRTWELMESDGRTPEQDIEMIVAACASRHHWSVACGPVEVATGEWQVARALSLLGDGRAGLRFARAALDRVAEDDDRDEIARQIDSIPL